jgi:O-acetyl-ADP-ribose deacetylase (regulator of RNase III)
MIKYMQGDLFESGAQALVNATNTHGIMGDGIALAFKIRFPDYFAFYRERCEKKLERVGEVTPFWDTNDDGDRVALISLHTMDDLSPARMEYVDGGLEALRGLLLTLGVESIALPALGCGIGGLQWEPVRQSIERFLGDLDPEILVYTPHTKG